jgi:hypothetical protein
MQDDVRGLKALTEAVGKRWLRGAALYTRTEALGIFGRILSAIFGTRA